MPKIYPIFRVVRGGPGGTPLVAWGPSFGDGTHQVVGQLDLGAPHLIGAFDVEAELDASAALAFDELNVSAALDSARAILAGALEAEAAAALTRLDVLGALDVETGLEGLFGFSGGLDVDAAAAMPAATLAGALAAGVDLQGALAVAGLDLDTAGLLSISSAALSGALAGQAAAAMPAAGLSGAFEVDAALAAAAAFTGGLDVDAAPLWSSAALTGQLAGQQGLGTPAAGLGGALAGQAVAAMPSAGLSGALNVGAAAALPMLAVTSQLSASGAFGSPQWIVADYLAPHDTWASLRQIAGSCLDVLNHDGSNLETGSNTGAGTAMADALLGWNLGQFPASATISTATLRLDCTRAAGSGLTMNTNKLANANEGWAEGSIACPSWPAYDGAVVQTFTPPTSTGTFAVNLNAAWISRLQARMGVGRCSIALDGGGVNTGQYLHGEGGATGPRLNLIFTTP